MTADDADQDYRDGHISKRAYVRRAMADGATMADALARAEQLVPESAAPAAPPTGGPESQGMPRLVDGLDVTFADDGYLVFDPNTRNGHYLNNTAAVVFELCTGTHRIEDIAELLGDAFGLDDRPVDETLRCVADLRASGLVR